MSPVSSDVQPRASSLSLARPCHTQPSIIPRLMPDVSSSMRTLLGSPRRRIALALISLVILQASVCFPAASGLPGVGNYDTAYYYAVARNLADGRGAIDTVLWHFLGPPETVVRPIGDYWPPGWPFLLAALMRVFGHSMMAAIGICATLSLLLPVLVFWLAYLVRPQTWLAWLAGVLVIFQNSLHQTNVTPDVSLPYALVTLLGLCAFMEHRRRRAPEKWLILVGALMTLPFWMRGEGFIPFGAITLTVLLSGDISWRRRAIRIGWLLLGSACCQLPLWLYNLFAFGGLTPEPRSMVLFFTDIPSDLYMFGSNPSFATWWGQGIPVILDNIGDRLYENAFAFFKQNPWALGGFAIVGMIRKVNGEPRFATTLPLTMFVVLSWLVPAILVPNGASADRLVLNTTPIQCILAVIAFDGLVRGRCRPPVLLVIGDAVPVHLHCRELAAENPEPPGPELAEPLRTDSGAPVTRRPTGSRTGRPRAHTRPLAGRGVAGRTDGHGPVRRPPGDA